MRPGNPSIRAVILTSPTYEGVLSNIGAIAAHCHAHEIPLIVDEAHGAHLGLFSGTGFPAGALSCGADLVIQSPHKTLPSLTQTAWLHLRGDRISSWLPWTPVQACWKRKGTACSAAGSSVFPPFTKVPPPSAGSGYWEGKPVRCPGTQYTLLIPAKF